MDLYYYNAKVVRVIDGDTIVCDIDLGFDTWIKNEHVRLIGINAPEVRTKDLEEKALGFKAKFWLTEFLQKYNNDVVLETVYKSNEKFGRTLAQVVVEDFERIQLINVNEKMIEEGYAIRYN